MSRNKIKADEFLKKYSMNPETIDIDKECKVFEEEMNAGLAGTSSLQMLPTYISADGEIALNERVIVMDAGGTNFRAATLYFNDEKKPVIENFTQHKMPGSTGEITKDEFYTTVAEYVKPILDKSDRIGFCFSYAMEALPDMDGKLIGLSKEVKVEGLTGEVIGKGVLNKLREMGCDADKKIVLMNDTVTTLLSGKALTLGKTYDSYIGYILGTGTNTCYSEENKNITKIDADKTKSMLINMESGGYAKAPRGECDERFDSQSVNPGVYAFEKMISGHYLGSVVNVAIIMAAEDGLLPEAFKSIDKTGEVVTMEVDDFIKNPYGNGRIASMFGEGDDDAREVLYYIIDGIIERASKLVAVNLIPIILKTNKGTSPLRPVCITTEGSTFYKLKGYKTKIEYYMKKYLEEKYGRYYEFIQVENASLIGAAIAALLVK